MDIMKPIPFTKPVYEFL